MLVRLRGTLPREQRTSHEALARLCCIDYAREIALVAVHSEPGASGAEILGVARLGRTHARNGAEFAVVVADRWQRRGLGTLLLGKLLEVGRDERVTRMGAVVAADNPGLRRLCENLGFRLTARPGGGGWAAAISLRRSSARFGPGHAMRGPSGPPVGGGGG